MNYFKITFLMALAAGSQVQAGFFARTAGALARTAQRVAPRAAQRTVATRAFVSTPQRSIVTATRSNNRLTALRAQYHNYNSYTPRYSRSRIALSGLALATIAAAIQAKAEEATSTQSKTGAVTRTPTYAERTAFLKAIDENNAEELATLVAQNKALLSMRCNVEGDTVLLYTIKKETDPKCIIKLIELGADVKARNKNAQTALHLTKNPDVAHALIAAKADINAQDNDGRTAAHLHNNNIPIDVFIQAKANLSIQDKDGYTPLNLAIAMCCLGRATELLKADPAAANIPVKNGLTPLHFLSITRPLHFQKDLHFALLHDIANATTDINAKVAGLGRPLDCAITGGLEETVSYLIILGADLTGSLKLVHEQLEVIRKNSIVDESRISSLQHIMARLVIAGATE